MNLLVSLSNPKFALSALQSMANFGFGTLAQRAFDKHVEAADLSNFQRQSCFPQLSFGLFNRECSTQRIEKVVFQDGMLVGCDGFDNLARSFRCRWSDQIHDVNHCTRRPKSPGLTPQHHWIGQMVQKVFRENSIEAVLIKGQPRNIPLQWRYPACVTRV